MDQRILLAVVVGLILAAFGGFYLALKPEFAGPALPPPPPPAVAPAPPAAAVTPAPPVPEVAAAPSPQAPEEPPAASPPPTPVPTAEPAPAPPSPAKPVEATAAGVEAEMALSDYGAIQDLLKKDFPDDYKALIDFAVQRRNAGATDQQFGQDVFERIQDILRAKLKFGTGASMATIDKLAGNEQSMFHVLGGEGARFCLRMLGKDDSPADAPPPESIRRLMAQGTLYRFEAIVEGMAASEPVAALTPDEMTSFEAALGREGLDGKEISSGAYLDPSAGDPGSPCRTLEKLHRAIATLSETTRRKIYAGMFFLGRDK